MVTENRVTKFAASANFNLLGGGILVSNVRETEKMWWTRTNEHLWYFSVMCKFQSWLPFLQFCNKYSTTDLGVRYYRTVKCWYRYIPRWMCTSLQRETQILKSAADDVYLQRGGQRDVEVHGRAFTSWCCCWTTPEDFESWCSHTHPTSHRSSSCDAA